MPMPLPTLRPGTDWPAVKFRVYQPFASCVLSSAKLNEIEGVPLATGWLYTTVATPVPSTVTANGCQSASGALQPMRVPEICTVPASVVLLGLNVRPLSTAVTSVPTAAQALGVGVVPPSAAAACGGWWCRWSAESSELESPV